jgi:hypothetical protein
MIACRLYHLAESNGWFSHLQAGFRKGRSCEDQILRITQAIEDGFQRKSMERSVLVLLDFSKAYDMVWKERLLLTMSEVGVPHHYLRWLYGFLQNRQANVRFCDATSDTRKMKQGLPQGSVLSPLLFLFYINELAKLLPADVVGSLFADDVGILVADRNRKLAEGKAQEAVNIVVNWSKQFKLTLNAGKSECCFFSTWTKESKWQPEVLIDGARIPFKQHPRLLGVLLDRQLSFGPQAQQVKEETTGKLKLLAALSHTEWGWKKHDLKVIFNAFIRSKLFYAAPAWQPWLSKTRYEELDRVQNKAMRIMSGQYKSTPVEALRAETDCQSFQTLSNRA